MRACSGVWVAHGSGDADRDTADREGRVWVPPEEKSYQIRRIWLTKEEEKGYYYGFSNEGLWPLCHVAHARPTFRSEDWAHYQLINRRFADAACAEAASDDPIILVQDYHFALAPRMIRERLPRATILTFWHIPWPNSERFAICPWHEELLHGMLGCQHPRLPHAVPLQQLPRDGRALPRGAHRSRAVRRGPRRAHDPGAPLSHLDRVAQPLAGDSAAGRRLPPLGLRRARPARQRAPRRGRRSSRLHQGHRGAAQRRRAPARTLSAPARPLHLRAAGGAEPHRHRALPRAQRRRRDAGGAHQRALRLERLPADHPAPRAPRAADGVPLLPRRRRLLRLQPARRHEPGGQGVRGRARRRGRRARAQPLHRRRSRADRGADRQPVRPRAGERGAGRGRDHVARRADRTHALDALDDRALQRLSLGGPHAHRRRTAPSTRTAERAACRRRSPSWRGPAHEVSLGQAESRDPGATSGGERGARVRLRRHAGADRARSGRRGDASARPARCCASWRCASRARSSRDGHARTSRGGWPAPESSGSSATTARSGAGRASTRSPSRRWSSSGAITWSGACASSRASSSRTSAIRWRSTTAARAPSDARSPPSPRRSSRCRRRASAGARRSSTSCRAARRTRASRCSRCARS